jgi:hypothetical protein
VIVSIIDDGAKKDSILIVLIGNYSEMDDAFIPCHANRSKTAG